MTFGSFLSHFRLPLDFAPTNASGRRAPLTLPFYWPFSRFSLCNLSVLCVSVVKKSGVHSLESEVKENPGTRISRTSTADSRLFHHRDTENTEDAQRKTPNPTTPFFNQENS